MGRQLNVCKKRKREIPFFKPIFKDQNHSFLQIVLISISKVTVIYICMNFIDFYILCTISLQFLMFRIFMCSSLCNIEMTRTGS